MKRGRGDNTTHLSNRGRWSLVDESMADVHTTLNGEPSMERRL
jgi:hypothetical protein